MDPRKLEVAKAHHAAYSLLIEGPVEQAALAAELGHSADDEIMQLATPAFVLGAFATELYLKCIIEHNGIKFHHKHNLRVLWEQLPESVRNQLDQAGFVAGSRLFGELTSFLERFASAFKDWRYPWDTDQASMDQSALDDALFLLREHCHSLLDT